MGGTHRPISRGKHVIRILSSKCVLLLVFVVATAGTAVSCGGSDDGSKCSQCDTDAGSLGR